MGACLQIRPQEVARTPAVVTPLVVIGSSVSHYFPDAEQPLWRRVMFIALVTLSLSVILPDEVTVSDVARGTVGFEKIAGQQGQIPVASFAAVWAVESTPEHELYSSGLRIENSYHVQNVPRFFQVLDRSDNMQPSTEWFSEPVGIVFHTTESPQVPFAAEENANLQKFGRGLLGHIQRNRSYNFVIDRFGRVFRVVDENDTANHAGNSIWADGNSAYLNLNASFLGVAFETATNEGTGAPSITKAQSHSARQLTEMLRAKYKIGAQNCVTHAQVSVNPSNMRIGYHTDWAANFPWAEVGLPSNYNLTLSSLIDFGFQYDETFARVIGGNGGWNGLAWSERQVAQAAAKCGREVDQYRAELKTRYRRLYSALKLTGALDESDSAGAGVASGVEAAASPDVRSEGDSSAGAE